MERPALALRCETAPGNGTFKRALRFGLDRELLASGKEGKKVNYSLTEASGNA